MRGTWVTLLAALLGCETSRGASIRDDSRRTVSFEEKRLAQVPPGAELDPIYAAVSFSPTGRAVMFEVTRGMKTHIVINDREGPGFADVRGKEFTAFTRRFNRAGDKALYVGMIGGKWNLVDFDGHLGERFDEISWVEVGPGDRIAYVARKGKEFKVVEGAKQGEPWDEISMNVVFAAGGDLCYVGMRNGQAHIVRGGRRHGPYEKARLLEQGFIVEHQGKVFYFDQGPGEPFDEISDWWLNDSGRLEYAARDGKDWFVVKEGKRTTDFATVELPVKGSRFIRHKDSWIRCVSAPGAVAVEEWYWEEILADGNGVVRATVEGKQRMAIGTEWGEPFDEISQTAQCPLGNDFAYVGVRMGAEDSETSYVCTAARKIGPLELVCALAFKPDGSLFFFGKRTGKWFMQGYDGKIPDDRHILYPTVCQTGKVLTVLAGTFALVFDEQGVTKRKGAFQDLRILPRSGVWWGKEKVGDLIFVWVGENRVGPFTWVDDIDSPRESEDGRKVAFGARIKGEFWWKVVEVTK